MTVLHSRILTIFVIGIFVISSPLMIITEELDVEYTRALESGADTTSIVAKKQELRDYPTQVDSATTTDEIKAVWDTEKLGDK